MKNWRMTIQEIIEKHYNILHREVDGEIVISQGRTSEDILQDACITAIRKFKHHDIEEDEGLSYLKKVLFSEKHFSWKRKKNEILVFTDSLPDIANY